MDWLDPPPDPESIPDALNDPFDDDPPPALAQRAARELMQALSARTHVEGKMYGVLVVRAADGRIGALKAFSGQMAGVWDVGGFVPPVFDRARREGVEPPGEATVKQLTARVEAYEHDAARLALEAEHAQLLSRHEREAEALRDRHRLQRAERHRLRVELERERATPEALHAIDQASRADQAELRREKLRWRTEREDVEGRHTRMVRRRRALDRLRRVVSQVVSWQIFDTYVFENRAGRRSSLRTLFAPKSPSSGTGDCALPKLLVFAQRHQLEPLACAEFWWGPPPEGGGRTEGTYFPACRDKCRPLLPFLLEGLRVAPRKRFRPPTLGAGLTMVYEDHRLLVIDKPPGLLSVPGTDATVTDSVWARVRALYPKASGPLLVHRLDLETSGLLLIALDSEAHAFLQAQFMERTVKKKYIAWLEGDVTRDAGVIELPLRVDLEQRPRQLVDHDHGKSAVTRFEVLARRDGRTRVAFFPESGRTHQLRVHASHPSGLGVPIVGDGLYGQRGERLLLHAESLSFQHPDTGTVLELCASAPF